jgi:hypothetical protein
MVRRDVVEAVGGYSPELKGAADMDLWIRVLEHGTGVIVPHPVVIYHLHSGQVTSDTSMMADAHRSVAERYAGHRWWSGSVLERWEGGARYDAARRAWRLRQRAQAMFLTVEVLRSPTRTLGAAGILLRRARLRRRSGLVDRHGLPTTALLPGAKGNGNGARDLRTLSTSRALAQLALRPSHTAVVGSLRLGLAARLLGAREVIRD